MKADCEKRKAILACKGHALVLGGPGSGKTTLALRKALSRARDGLVPGQTALFLSFSRAAVARVVNAATKELEISKTEMSLLSIQTFHSFFWGILKTHGYLLGAPPKISLLLPQDEKALSGGITEDDDSWGEWAAKREQLFNEQGRVAFDLFAPKASDLLSTSVLIRQLVAKRHPLVIVDEAQDTGDHAWRCIELIAPHAQVICLADLEQQIYDFLPGVGPERVAAIRASLKPTEVDLGTENHRSPDTEILEFGNDILTDRARGAPYKGVSCIRYRPEKPPPDWNLLLRISLARLHKGVRMQSNETAKAIAILVTNNRSALKVSNALNAVGDPFGKQVKHKLLFDEAEALLSARFAAFLLEPKIVGHQLSDIATAMEMIAAARRATGGARTEVAKLLAQAAKVREGKPPKTNLVAALRALINEIDQAGLTGDPAKDWQSTKVLLRNSGQAELVRVAAQLDFLVAFNRGHRISAGLSAEWLRHGAYSRARLALDTALAQEQIFDGLDAPPGVQVMNFHKSKGKQFDGVIVIREARRTENSVSSSFLWRGDDPPYPKSRRLLRVAITRARHCMLLLDPMWPTCPLLKGHKL
jgi:DNA helicase II / ATP-dependent DNA helicase PcrA